MKYVVTAFNALSGQREAISNPLEHARAFEILEKMKRDARRSRSKSVRPWSRPHIEAAWPELHFVPE